MLLLCQVCCAELKGELTEEQLSRLVCPKCEHVAERFFELENKLFKERMARKEIQEAVMTMIRRHHEQFAEQPDSKIVVDCKYFSDIWDAIQGKWYECDTAKAYIKEYALLFGVYFHAQRLFRDKPVQYQWNTVLEKLEKLHEDVKEYWLLRGCDKDPNDQGAFGLTPEQVVKQASREAK